MQWGALASVPGVIGPWTRGPLAGPVREHTVPYMVEHPIDLAASYFSGAMRAI